MKTSTLALILCVGFAAAGCGSKGIAQIEPSDATPDQETVSPVTPMAPEAAAEHPRDTADEEVIPDAPAEEVAPEPLMLARTHLELKEEVRLPATQEEQAVAIHSFNGADYFKDHPIVFEKAENPIDIQIRPIARQDLSRFFQNVPLKSLPCPDPDETKDADGNCISEN